MALRSILALHFVEQHQSQIEASSGYVVTVEKLNERRSSTSTDSSECSLHEVK